MVKQKLIEKQPFKGKIAILCGASEGMGKSLAEDFVRLGGSVCINARRLELLKNTAEEIEKLKMDDSQFVEYISCDATDMDKMKPLLENFISKHGVPDYLFNIVGIAFPDYFEKISIETFKKNMDINYYGQLVPILILLPHFIKEKKGHIVNFSSILGFMGFLGYGSYIPTKYAIAGLSELLRHELKPYNIKVSVVYPPDTNTPGLTTESEGKPQECVIMSETGGLLEPEEVSEYTIKQVLKGKLHISPGRTKVIHWIHRVFPKLVRGFLDNDYRKARKKLGKPYKY